MPKASATTMYDMQWVSVSVFGKAADAAATLKKGDRVYCEGTIKLDTWRGSDGIERHTLAVSSFKCEQTHKIGRARDKRSSDHGRDDDHAITDETFGLPAAKIPH
jgi:single-stranded DNA-binding protein